MGGRQVRHGGPVRNLLPWARPGDATYYPRGDSLPGRPLVIHPTKSCSEVYPRRCAKGFRVTDPPNGLEAEIEAAAEAEADVKAELGAAAEEWAEMVTDAEWGDSVDREWGECDE